MKQAFRALLVTSLGSATRSPSEIRGQIYLERGTKNLQIELAMDAPQILAQKQMFPNSTGILDAPAEDGLLMSVQSSLLNLSDDLRRGDALKLAEKHSVTQPNDGEDPFAKNGAEDSCASPFKSIPGTPGKKYTYLQFLGSGSFGNAWSVVEDRPPAIDDLLSGFRMEVIVWLEEREAANRWGENYYQPAPNLEIPENYCARMGFNLHGSHCPEPAATIKVAKITEQQMSAKARVRIWTEVRSLEKLKNNKHVSQVYDAFQDNNGRYYIVMEYLPGGDLYDTVMGQKYGEYTLTDAKEWFRDLAGGLASMHEVRIAHRDVKLANLMFTSFDHPRKLKFIDFGFACDAYEKTEESPGTKGYRAPEVRKVPHQPYAADVWSLGVVLFLILAGANGNAAQEPFPDDEALAAGWTLEHEQYLQRLNIPKVVIAICRAMLKVNVNERNLDLRRLRSAKWA